MSEEVHKSEAPNRVRDAAERLERHIRTSGLKPGDRYLSAEQAGQLVGHSVMTVQRAMALLARRQVLERRPKAGTFVGEKALPERTLSCLHFLLPEQFEAGGRESYWSQLPEHIQGIRSVLPQLSAQFNFIPNQDLAYTRQIVEVAEAAGTLAGVVLVLPSRAMKVFFNQSGIPTVVEGGVEPDLANLGWLQWDQAQIGRLLTAYLLDRGHRRLASIMRDVWTIGEHHLHDGISDALSAAGLSSSALRMRSAPSERLAIGELVRGLLASGENAPTGLICRSEFQADCASEVVSELGLGSKVEIVVCNTPGPHAQGRYVSVEPEIGAFETGKMVGELFLNMRGGSTPSPRGHEINVRLKA